MIIKYLIEAKADFMTKREEKLKKKLIALLRDDGKGNRHAMFAKRLEDFDIKIVSLIDDPNMTAAISFDEATIYISEGFLLDEATFFQLNVLMRHELAHNLMMHQIRMMHKIIEKYGEEGYTHIKESMSLHDLENVIEDFEISNKRYTQADKAVVRNMYLNGKLIGGLVTDTIRDAWKTQSVEEMYESLLAEIDKINNDITSSWWQQSWTTNISRANQDKSDWMDQRIRAQHVYTDSLKGDSNYIGVGKGDCTIDNFIANKVLYHFAAMDVNVGQPVLTAFKHLPKLLQQLVIDLNDVFGKNAEYYTQDQVDKIMEDIAKSSLRAKYDVVDPVAGNIICTLYTPEEKALAIDTLKQLKLHIEEDKIWYEKVKQLANKKNLSKDDLTTILDAIKD